MAESKLISGLQTPPTEIKPPHRSKQVLPWLKENLFSTWYNSLLTLLALGVVYVLLKSILTWAFTAANWDVIPANLQLFAVGSYPRAQLWRVWMVLYLLSTLVGLSAAMWRGLTFRLTLAAGWLGAVLIFQPLELGIRLEIFNCVVLLAVSFLLGRNREQWKPWVVGGWLLSFPWTLLMLRGFGENYVLTTNWGGLLLTLMLAAVGIVFCFPLGVLLALGRRSTLPAVRWVSTAYIELIRGVPLITILFMAQIMIPIFMPEVRLDKVLRAMLGITLFSAAYMAENVRGGLQAIPKGQYEAAQAVGLNYVQTTLFIVLPQALRAVIPAIVGQFISLFKDTSLVTIVGLLDLLGIAKTVISNPDWLGLQAEVYLFVAAIYFVFSYSMSYISQQVEAALGVGKT